MKGPIDRPDLSQRPVRRKLRERSHAYWHLFAYSRHLGYLKRPKKKPLWVVRARNKQGGYIQKNLGLADDRSRADGIRCLSFEQAARMAQAWFFENSSLFSDALHIGFNEQLIYSPVGEFYTVGHALRDFMEMKKLVAARSTAETLYVLINFHLLPRVGTLPAQTFNGERLREFVRDVLETPPKYGNRQLGPKRPIESLDEESLRKRKATTNTLIGILRGALKTAWENRRIDVMRPRMLHLSRSECRKLLACCKPDLAKIVLGILYTGCRINELLHMQASHVGRDGYGVYVLPMKTYKSRFVFLPDEGMVFFRDLAKRKHPNDRLFVRDDGREWRFHYSYEMKKAVREAGLPAGFGFHGLRHTYASQLVQAGAPLPVVAEQLGHVSSDTVSRTYAHMAPQIRESEVRQRFSQISRKNAQLAKSQSTRLTRWRGSLHGKTWRTYAKITEKPDGARLNRR